MGFYKAIKSKRKGEKKSCKDVEIAFQGAVQRMNSCTGLPGSLGESGL